MATAPTREADAERTLGFDALYRSCRDDVYAYVAGLLRDRHAAEDVTALAFERAYRRRRGVDPPPGPRPAAGVARAPHPPPPQHPPPRLLEG